MIPLDACFSVTNNLPQDYSSRSSHLLLVFQEYSAVSLSLAFEIPTAMVGLLTSPRWRIIHPTMHQALGPSIEFRTRCTHWIHLPQGRKNDPCSPRSRSWLGPGVFRPERVARDRYQVTKPGKDTRENGGYSRRFSSLFPSNFTMVQSSAPPFPLHDCTIQLLGIALLCLSLCLIKFRRSSKVTRGVPPPSARNSLPFFGSAFSFFSQRWTFFDTERKASLTGNFSFNLAGINIVALSGAEGRKHL